GHADHHQADHSLPKVGPKSWRHPKLQRHHPIFLNKRHFSLVCDAQAAVMPHPVDQLRRKVSGVAASVTVCTSWMKSNIVSSMTTKPSSLRISRPCRSVLGISICSLVIPCCRNAYSVMSWIASRR